MSSPADSLVSRAASRRALAMLALAAACLPIDAGLRAASRSETTPLHRAARASDPARTFGPVRLPLEPNRGQAPAGVDLVSRPNGQLVTLTSTEARVSFLRATARSRDPRAARLTGAATGDLATVTIAFVGAARREVALDDRLPGHTNYYAGADRSRWVEGVPHYARAAYRDVYPGIGLAWYGNAGQLEHDWLIDPGADPRRITMRIDGASRVSLDPSGDLRLATTIGAVVARAPIAWQPAPDGRREVAAHFVLQGANLVGFELGAYDPAQPLVIDPVLAFSTYFGGANFEDSPEIAVDDDQNVYLGIRSASTSLPGGAVSSGGTALVIAKLDPQATTVLYTTVLSGSDPSFLDGVAVDDAGNAYVTGSTTAPDFPVTAGAFQTAPRRNISNFINPNSMDVIVFKLAGNGAIVYGTYLGGRGTDFASAIAVNDSGQVCVTGVTGTVAFGNFPLKNEFQGGVPTGLDDAFVTVLNATGSDLVYSTRLRAGGGDEEGRAVAFDRAGRVYVAGHTNGNNLQVKGQFGTAPFQDENAGGIDAWVAKFDPTASGDASLLYATYLGGVGTDSPRGIVVDALNRAYVTGITGSTNFPLRAASGASILDSSNIVNEAFVTELNANATGLVFSTFLGGSNAEDGTGIGLDAASNIFVSGFTSSANFPRVQAITPGFAGVFDAFVTKIVAGGTAIAYSTTFGGSGDDRGRALAVHVTGAAVVAGTTTSVNLPTQPGVIQEDPSANIGQGDGFVLRINP